MNDYSQEDNAVVATTIFKMKVQQTVEKIEEEHLQDTCRAEMIFEDDEEEEDEEIQMEDLEQAPLKFKDTQPQVHDLMEEVNLDTMEEPRITYIRFFLLISKKGLLQHYRNSRLLCLELRRDARIGQKLGGTPLAYIVEISSLSTTT